MSAQVQGRFSGSSRCAHGAQCEVELGRLSEAASNPLKLEDEDEDEDEDGVRLSLINLVIKLQLTARTIEKLIVAKDTIVKPVNSNLW